MDGRRCRWLLLHGTPLTPQVWDGIAGYLRGYGPVWRPDVTPPAGSPDAQAALATHLASALEPSPERLHMVGHSFGGQIAIDFALLAPQRVQALTLICTRDTPFPAFAAAAARLRHGDPVDITTALRRWFTAPELSVGGPVVAYAAVPAASRPGRVGGRAGRHRQLRPGQPRRRHRRPAYPHRGPTRPRIHPGGDVGPRRTPAAGKVARTARRRAHDTLQ